MINTYSKIILPVLFLGLAGCSTYAKKIIGPDGTENVLVACAEIEDCYGKATEDCRGPYKIVNTNSETSGANGYVGTTIKLLVKCGGESTIK